MGVYYRPPSQDGDADELLFKELRDTSKLTTHVLRGDFNLANVNWEYCTATTNRSRRFLNTWMEHYMVQTLREPTQKDALLGLLLINREDLVTEVEIGSCLGHSDHEAIEFKTSVCSGN